MGLLFGVFILFKQFPVDVSHNTSSSRSTTNILPSYTFHTEKKNKNYTKIMNSVVWQFYRCTSICFSSVHITSTHSFYLKMRGKNMRIQQQIYFEQLFMNKKWNFAIVCSVLLQFLWLLFSIKLE